MFVSFLIQWINVQNFQKKLEKLEVSDFFLKKFWKNFISLWWHNKFVNMKRQLNYIEGQIINLGFSNKLFIKLHGKVFPLWYFEGSNLWWCLFLILSEKNKASNLMMKRIQFSGGLSVFFFSKNLLFSKHSVIIWEIKVIWVFDVFSLKIFYFSKFFRKKFFRFFFQFQTKKFLSYSKKNFKKLSNLRVLKVQKKNHRKHNFKTFNTHSHFSKKKARENISLV